MKQKIILGILIAAIILLPHQQAKAVSVLKPFGGKIMVAVSIPPSPPDCPGGYLVDVGFPKPLTIYIPPVPLIAPPLGLYSFYNFFTPDVWVLGLASPEPLVCFGFPMVIMGTSPLPL